MCLFFSSDRSSLSSRTPPSGEIGVDLRNLPSVGQRQLKLPGATTFPKIPLGQTGVSLNFGLPRLF